MAERYYVGGGVSVDALAYDMATGAQRRRMIDRAAYLAVKANPRVTQREIIEMYANAPSPTSFPHSDKQQSE